MKDTIPFAERIKEQSVQRGVESLDVLAQPPTLFFQGLAALTGLRRQRENLGLLLHWQEELRQESRRPDRARRNPSAIPRFGDWLLWGADDLLTRKDGEALFHLLLEPMYWLEESAYSKEGVSSNGNR